MELKKTFALIVVFMVILVAAFGCGFMAYHVFLKGKPTYTGDFLAKAVPFEID